MKNKALVFSPQPNATIDDVMQVLKLVFFQTYPPEIRTSENMMVLYGKLPASAKRHFQLKDTDI